MDKSSSDSLYNEERNLLRARERERRIREAQQGKTNLPAKPPLFAAPYKTDKADDLSNQIRKVLGNYEDVKGLINSKTQGNFLGLHEVLPPVSPEAPDFPHFLDENTSAVSSSSFHDTTHHPLTTAVTAPPAHHSTPYELAQSRKKPDSGSHVQSGSSSRGQSQSHKRSRGVKERHEGLLHKGTDRRAAGEGRAGDLDYSIFQFSLFLTPLPSPLEPLSPLRSDLHVNSKSEKSSKSQELTYSQAKSFQDLVTGSEEEQSQDSSDIDLTSSTRPSSQTFPTALPSKSSGMQQKPTAYVRPMEVQEQAPEDSPDLKPLLEEYHREPFAKISDLKQTFHCDAQAVNEILKEMTRSWPPLLTDIPPPTTAEPSKFPFPTEQTFHCDAQAVNEILKEMTRSWPPLLTDIPPPTTAEPSKFPFPTEQTFHCDAQAVNEILKEMTRSWPPLLTDIPPPTTAEPSKFPFPTEQTFHCDAQAVNEILKEMTRSWPPLLTDIPPPTTAEPSKFPFPTEQTFHCDAQAVNEILKEMTRSWPPLLTDIPPPTTAEPSKFPFPTEQTFHCDAQAVNEILKEMTRSWPPLLTDIPPPTTAEPSKFPFPTEESQCVGCVAQNQTQYAAPSDTLLCSQATISASEWKASYGYQTKDFLPPPLPPVSPTPKSTKVARKRPRKGSEELSAIGNTSKDPLMCKHRKVEGTEADLSKDIKSFLGSSTQHRMSCD